MDKGYADTVMFRFFREALRSHLLEVISIDRLIKVLEKKSLFFSFSFSMPDPSIRGWNEDGMIGMLIRRPTS